MLNNIKNKYITILASIFFLMGLFTFTLQQANAANKTNQARGGNPCYSCGSVSSCEDGGLSSGYTSCEIHHEQIGTPEGCQVSNYYCQEAG